jgi:hypothetical protein
MNYTRKRNQITIFHVHGVYFEELKAWEQKQAIQAIADKEGISYEQVLSELA